MLTCIFHLREKPGQDSHHWDGLVSVQWKGNHRTILEQTLLELILLLVKQIMQT